MRGVILHCGISSGVWPASDGPLGLVGLFFNGGVMKRISLFLILIFASVNAGAAVDYETAGSRWDWMHTWFENNGFQGYKQFITSLVVYDSYTEAREASPGWAGPIYLPISYSCTGSVNSVGFYFAKTTTMTPIQMQQYAVHMFDGCGVLDPDRDGVGGDDGCGNSIIDETDNQLGANVEMVDAYGFDGIYGYTGFVENFPVKDDGCLDLGLAEMFPEYRILSVYCCDPPDCTTHFMYVALKDVDGQVYNYQVGSPCSNPDNATQVADMDDFPGWSDSDQLEEIIQFGDWGADFLPDVMESDVSDYFLDIGDVFELDVNQTDSPVNSPITDQTAEYNAVDDSSYIDDQDYYGGMIDGLNGLGSTMESGFSSVVSGLAGLDESIRNLNQDISIGGFNVNTSGIESRLDQLHDDLGALSFDGTFDMSSVESRLDELLDKFGETSFDNYGALDGLESDIYTAADTSGLFAGTDSDIPDVWAPAEEHNTALDDHALTIQSFFDNFITFDVSGTSSFSATLLGKNIVFDFSNWESQINFFGSILVSFAGFTAFLIIFKR